MAKEKVAAVNNVELKNYDIPAGCDEKMYQQIMEQMKAHQRLQRKNNVELAGEVVEKRETEPKPIMDKDGNPVIDENGQLKTYPANYFIKIAFNGGEKEIKVDSKWYSDIELNEMYLFTGRLGLVKSFGKETIDVIFQNYTLL